MTRDMDGRKGQIRADAGPNALSDQVRRRITDLIRSRSLASGQVIIEQRLAEQLGVSRTPLREALQRLEGEGVIQKNSGRSYMVRRVDFPEYLQSLKLRKLIEPEAAALSIGRIAQGQIQALRDEIEALQSNKDGHTEAHWDSDDRIHRFYGRNSGNAVMCDVIERLRVTTRLFEITDILQRVDADYTEHSEILTALEAGDADRARAAVAAHLQSLIAYSLTQIG